MKKIALVLVVFLSVFAVFAGAQQEGGSEETMSGDYAFGGSTTLQGFIEPAIDEFVEMYPEVSISYDGPGSSAGISGALNGTYTLGAASKVIPRDDIDSGAKFVTVALDGIACIVNKDTVSIDNLTKMELQGIFAGEITNWNEVGGLDAEIVVVNRDSASGTRAAFVDMVMKKPEKKDFTDGAIITTGNGDMVKKVAEVPYAIGFCGLAYVDREAGAKGIKIDGNKATMDNVLSGKYSISRPLNIVFINELGNVEKAFVEYLLGSDGQAIIEDEGFIPLPDDMLADEKAKL